MIIDDILYSFFYLKPSFIYSGMSIGFFFTSIYCFSILYKKVLNVIIKILLTSIE